MRAAPGLAPWTGPTERVGQLLMLDARGEDLSFVNTRQPGALLHILGAKIGGAMDLAAKNRLGIPLLTRERGARHLLRCRPHWPPARSRS